MSLLSSSVETQTEDAETVPASHKLAAIGWRKRFAAMIAANAWFAVAGITLAWPDLGDWGRAPEFALGAGSLAIFFALAAIVPSRFAYLAAKLFKLAPWGIVSGIFFAVWQSLTAKSAILPMPFFPPPHAILEVFTDDWGKLLESVIASLKLLMLGVLIGSFVGFITGVSIGWSRAVGYWVHPIMRLIGPLPSIAWLPIAFFVFPSSWSASIFLIALAVGFPMAVLTWSGVANVNPAYYDVARTLGANSRFLILKVAIPAALPQVFVGAFMGLGASFAVLVTAEMMGVKAGLGFYLQWAQGWAAYANMYAALLIMSLMCSGLITALFKLRDHLLAYQKGALKW
jgi:NitT/TauT family transport system permease protein